MKITKTTLVTILIVIAPYLVGLFSESGFWLFLGIKAGFLGTLFWIVYVVDRERKVFKCATKRS